MMKACWRSVILILLVMLWPLLLPLNAEAALQICNRSANVIWLAVAEGQDEQRHAQGWYGLDIDTCRSFFGSELKNRYYYGHAFDADGNVWEGGVNFCVHPKKTFTIFGGADCEARLEGAEQRGFFEIDTGEALHFTHELSGFEEAAIAAKSAKLAKPQDRGVSVVDLVEAAWARQDYEAVLARVRPAAETGHAWAMNILGLMYLYGYGIPKSHSEGFKWIRQAASKGWGKAQYNLARLLYESPDGASNVEQVIFWLRLAALQGIVAAQQSLHAIQQTSQINPR